MLLEEEVQFFKVLLAGTMKNAAFWDVMPCNMVEVYQPQKAVFFKWNFVGELYGIYYTHFATILKYIKQINEAIMI